MAADAPPWSIRSFRREIDPEALAAEATNELERLYYTHQGRRIHKWHHYLEVYDRHFAGRRGEPVGLLEIGAARGGSLELWRKYFGPEARIFGVDVNPRCREWAPPDTEVRIGSQADPDFLESVVDELGDLDIVIDDGSHQAADQIASFETLFPLLAPDGIYVCEDLHYVAAGSDQPAGTFMGLVTRMVNWLHSWYMRDPEDPYGFAEGVFGISIYDSIVVIEKRPTGRPFHGFVGELSD